jgi:hypothetical protein
VLVLAGCAGSDGKYGAPRGPVDHSIYYVEKDKDNRAHPLSSADATDRTVTQVPLRTVVDLNSTIQILVAKDKLAQGAPSAPPISDPPGLLQRKKAITDALGLIEKVVSARLELIAAYKQGDLAEFQRAARARATIETRLLDELAVIWPETTETYLRLDRAYDPPSYAKLQAFLSKEIEAIDADNRAYEERLRTRQRTLSIEAFLNSPGRDDAAAAAIHVDGYDAIKEQSLVTRDRLGLDLSPEEYARLQAQVQATQNVAAALERLRRGEATLNETVRQLKSEMAPEIAKLLDEAQVLAARLAPSELAARRARTQERLTGYLREIRVDERAMLAERRAALQKELEALLEQLRKDSDPLAAALTAWIQTANSLKTKWEGANPATLVNLIQETSQVIRGFEQFRESLPKLADSADQRIATYIQQSLDRLENEFQVLASSDASTMLRNNLREYVRDFRQVVSLVQRVLALRKVEVNPIAEIPASTSAAFNVPLEDLKDTFVDLEATPRLLGDVITVKATLKDGSKKALDTSVASFRMGRYGYYADLSPAVVLVKPTALSGGDDGFRFAPSLSWMHHWPPRPEDRGPWSSFLRSVDPAIGIHSVFTNFSNGTATNSVQIGLGGTLSFWKNRLQFGAGYNLMARSNDQGRRYFFIGSDLIGLLQAVGLAKQ